MTCIKQKILDKTTKKLDKEYKVEGKILQFGIVAIPEYTFKINESNIIIGKTGIYELSTVNFQQTTLILPFSDESDIVLDLLYDDSEGLTEKGDEE